MIINYDILTQLSVHHNYFGSNVLSCVNIVPSQESLKLANNLGVLFKYNNGVLSLLVNSEKVDSKSVLDVRLQSPFEFTFYLINQETYWTNITDLEFDKNKTYYFSNDQLTVRNNACFLHKKNEISEEDAIYYTIDGTNLPLTDFDVKTSQLFKKSTEIETCLYGLINSESDLKLKTPLLDEGYYTLIDNKNHEINFFLMKEKKMIEGICHLKFSPDFDEESSIINSDWSWDNKQLKLNFPSRSTYWRYYFSKESIEQFEGLAVISEDGNLFFDGGKIVRHQNGIEMIVFESNHTILLQSQVVNHFQLKKNVGHKTRTESILINKLPTPSKEDLFRMGSDGKRYSDIYINF